MTEPADIRTEHGQGRANSSERFEQATATGVECYEARDPSGGEFDIAVERGHDEAGVRVSGQGGIRSAQAIQSVLRSLVREGALSIVLDLRGLSHVAAVAVAGVAIGFSNRRRCESVFTLVLPDEGTREVLTECCRGGDVRLRVSPQAARGPGCESAAGRMQRRDDRILPDLPASGPRSCSQRGQFQVRSVDRKGEMR